MAEVWRPIPAHAGFGVPHGYQASTLGRIRSMPRRLPDGRDAGGALLALTPDKDGYLRVTVGRRKIGVHTLVLLAFHGPPEGRHLHGDRQDNRPTELAWGSKRDNGQDKWKQKLGQEAASPPSEFGTLPKTPIRLSEAVRDGIVTGSLAAARKCRERDEDFPSPVALESVTMLYNASELLVWDRRRRGFP